MSIARKRERYRRKIKREVQRMAAWAVVIAFELVVSAALAATTAVIVLPIAYRERGYIAYGGEWLLIAIVFCAAYYAIHNAVCDRIFEEV